MTGPGADVEAVRGAGGSQVRGLRLHARLRQPVRLLLMAQAEGRSGRLIWSAPGGDRSLLVASGLVVGAEGQPESFLEHLGRTMQIPAAALAAVERRVRDLFLPMEREMARVLGVTVEEISARRRDFTIRQMADLTTSDADTSAVRFAQGDDGIPGAACRVAPATALADLLTEGSVRGAWDLVFAAGTLRPTRYFPRLAPLIEGAFPWPLPLPRAGGESAAAILSRTGDDRRVALWLMVAAGLFALEPPGTDRKPSTAMPGAILQHVHGPIETLETLERRLAEDPFNQEAIESLERLAAEEGWPDLLMEAQDRQIAKALPPQRGYYFLRLAALAEIARAPARRLAEVIALGRRCLPDDFRLASAHAAGAFEEGDPPRGAAILADAGIPWPPAALAVEAPQPPVPPGAEQQAVPHEPPAALPAAEPEGETLDDTMSSLVDVLSVRDERPIDGWMTSAVGNPALLRRSLDAVLAAARDEPSQRPERLAAFAESLRRTLDAAARDAVGTCSEAARSEAYLLLAEALAVHDKPAAAAAALRAVEEAPDHEPAVERLETLTFDTRDADTLDKGYALVERRIEGAHNRSAFAYRAGRTFEARFHRLDLALAAYLRALGHQPRSGAVLASVERLAKLAGDRDALVKAYRDLAGRSDGAQRAYWRSRLVEMGAEPAADDQDSGWDDLLDESAPGAGQRAEQPPGVEEDVPDDEPTRLYEPPGGIEEALLRATPALGIKIVTEVARGWTRKAEPQPAVGDQPSAGADQPSAGADQSSAGADQSSAGADQSSAGADQPSAGADQPSAGADQSSAGADQQPATGDRFMQKVAALRMAEEEEGVEPVGDEDISWLDDNVEVIIGDRVLSDASDVPSGAAQVPPDAGDVAPAASLVPPTTTTTTTTTITGPVSGAATIQVVDEGDEAERDLLDRLRSDVTDTSALAELATVRRLRGRRGAVWAAEAVLSAFDPSVRPQQAPAAAPQPAEDVLARFGPWEADVLHRAAGMIWNSAASAFAEGLSARGVRPADQVSPLGGTDLSRAVAAFSETLLFFRFQVYRRSGVRGFDVVRTVPPSVLLPGETDDAVGPTVVAAGIAACVSSHVLPMSLSASERDAFLRGLLAAFGPPDRMDKLSPRAAAMAQDLWHFVPPRGQAALREALAAAPPPPADAWLEDVRLRCLLLAAYVRRDVPAALRLAAALGDDVPADAPADPAGFRDAARRSRLVSRLAGIVLSDAFSGAFWK